MNKLTTKQIHEKLTELIKAGDLDEETKEAVDAAKTIVGAFPQILWERNAAIKQLEDLGYEFGEKIEKEEEKESGN